MRRAVLNRYAGGIRSNRVARGRSAKMNVPFVSDEDYVGWCGPSSTAPSAEGYININQGGFTVDGSDGVTTSTDYVFGVCPCTLNSATGTGGQLRQTMYSIPVGGVKPGLEWGVKFSNEGPEPSVAEDAMLMFGMLDGAISATADGIFFRYDKTIGEWVFVHQRLSTEATLNTGLGWEDDGTSFHTLGWVVSADGNSFDVYADGEKVGTCTPVVMQFTVDLASCAPAIFWVSAAHTTDQIVTIDRVRWEHPAL